MSGITIGLSGSDFAPGKSVRFGLATDSHYAEREPANNRFYRQALQRMAEFTAEMNKEQVDFVMHLGDFKDENPNKNSRDTLQYLIELEKRYAQFKGPKYHCVGNHDVDSITKNQFLSNIENTGIPKNESFYSFDLRGFHFVVLDANFNADGSDQYYLEGADWQDIRIPQNQMEWLKSDLERSPYPTIVFCHHPLLEYHYKGYKMHIHNFPEVQQLLESSGKVIAVFQGHVHEESVSTIKGIHYVTQNAMVEYDGLANNCFSIVSIQESVISITGYKRNSSFSLPTD